MVFYKKLLATDMSKLKPYTTYYPVQYDYVSQLPESWKLLPNLAIFQERKERGFELEELLSVTIGKGVIRQSDLDKKDSSTLDKSKYLLVHPGDLVYSMRFRQGASGYSTYKGIVSPACTVLRPKAEINQRYYHYLFRTGFYKNYIERFSYGIADGQIPLRYVDFKRMYSIFPPIETQNTIVEYLDQKTAQIQEFIAKKERLVELLEEQKQVFIGKIFQDFDSSKTPLKYLITKIGSGLTPLGGATTYVNKGIIFLRSQNIHFEGLHLDDVAYISENVHSQMKGSQVKFKDVLLNITGASIGRCTVFDMKKEANVNQHVCIIRPNSKMSSRFLAYYLSTTEIQDEIKNSQDGASREGLALSNIRKFQIPNIDKQNQQIIVEQIQNKASEIQNLISKAKLEIEKAKEYQESLITQVVTGQLQVPMSELGLEGLKENRIIKSSSSGQEVLKSSNPQILISSNPKNPNPDNI